MRRLWFILPFLAVLVSVPAGATVTMVQHKGTAGTSNNSVTVSPTSNPTSGNLMITFVSVFSSSTAQPLWKNNWFPISDTIGNTWYPCSFVEANAASVRLSSIGSTCFWAIDKSTAADTITCALDAGISTQQLTCQYREYSGIDTTTPFAFGTLKSSGCCGGSTGTSASTTITPEDAGSLIVACTPWETTTVVPTSSTLSNLEVDPNTGDTSTHNPLVCADNTNASATSTTASFSFGSTTESYDLYAWVFRPSGAHSNSGGKLVNLTMADGLVTTDTTRSVTLAANSGNTILMPVTLAGWTSGVSISSVQDDLSNNFTLSHTCAQDTTHGKFVCIYYLSNVTAGSRTFTVTLSGGTAEIEMWPMQVQGIGSLLTSNTATGSTSPSAITSPSLTTAAAAFFVWNVTVQAEFWMPDTSHSDWFGGSSDNNGCEYSDNLAAGTYNPNATPSSNSWWLTAGAAFAQGGGGGSSAPPPTQMMLGVGD